MQKLSNKFVAIAISLLMIISIGGGSSLLLPNAHALVNLPTTAEINVAPSPCGVGQFVTIDLFLAVPLLDSEHPPGLMVYGTAPDGSNITLGPFIGDATGGTHTTYTVTQTGIYKFYTYFPGFQLTSTATSAFLGTTYNNTYEEPSTSPTVTVTVTNTPASQYPFTPLPTTYWQTPVNAENVQNWYALTGPWLGTPEPFGATGMYNGTCAQDCGGGNFNPFTTVPTTGHILWTTPWVVGGVAGGNAGPSESSDYWVTRQYQPQWAPVVLDGVMYSTWYTTCTGYNNGIRALDLYTGQQLWVINTTNPLVMGMAMQHETVNTYGYVGPYIWTTGTLPAGDTGGTRYNTMGTEWNMYDGLTGKYVCSIVNGTGDSVGSGALYWDPNDVPMLVYDNGTAGRQIIHPNQATTTIDTTTGPSLCLFNFSQAFGTGDWSRTLNSQILWNAGIMNEANITSPVTLSQDGIGSDTIILGSNGGVSGEFGGGETGGWWYMQGFNIYTLALEWTINVTETPFTRTSKAYGENVMTDVNVETGLINAYSLSTGAFLWTNTLTGFNGAPYNAYNVFDIYSITGVNGVEYYYGFGGDMWAINLTNGNLIWYTNTTALFGSPGLETPYGTWTLWIFGNVVTNGQLIIYSMGHNYDPPLYHGAQQFALNCTNGQLVWNCLGFFTMGTELSYGIKLGLNAYDGQIYAFGQGPSSTTVSAPDIGVTTATPIEITGTVMDVSAGTQQEAVKLDFPNGLPCVSDASQSQWMPYVYEQQPFPTNVTGVPVTLTDIDPNGNSYTIGTTTSDSSGTYALKWTPTVEGSYTIIATFAGSGAYYGSCAETHLYAGAPPATPAPTAPPVTGLASFASLEYGIVAVIIVIIVIGAVLAILTLRKRP